MAQQVLIVDPPNELRFKGFFEQGITTYMSLKNPTNDTVLFKIKTTAPKKYCVRPNSGILDPNGKIDIAITPHDTTDASEIHKHKFMVQSIIAPKGKFNADQVWKEVNPEQIMDLKLKCLFEQQRGNNVNDSGDVGQTEATKKRVALLEENKAVKKDVVEEAGLPEGKRKEEDNTSNAKTTSTNKAENPEMELQKKCVEVMMLRETESKLRYENLQLKEELLRLRQNVASGGGKERLPSLHSFEKQQSSMMPWLAVAIAMAFVGILLGKYFL